MESLKSTLVADFILENGVTIVTPSEKTVLFNRIDSRPSVHMIFGQDLYIDTRDFNTLKKEIKESFSHLILSPRNLVHMESMINGKLHKLFSERKLFMYDEYYHLPSKEIDMLTPMGFVHIPKNPLYKEYLKHKEIR